MKICRNGTASEMDFRVDEDKFILFLWNKWYGWAKQNVYKPESIGQMRFLQRGENFSVKHLIYKL